MKAVRKEEIATGAGDTFEEVMTRRFARRSFLKGALAGAPLLVLNPLQSVSTAEPLGSAAAAHSNGLTFTPISLSRTDDVIVPPGYSSKVLLRWGDPILPGAPQFYINSQSAEKQAQQFGYNCDFVGFFPLPRFRSNNSNSGILAVNHEYTNPELMFPGYSANNPTEDQVNIEIAAHGLSFAAIRNYPRRGWHFDIESPVNRRITGETEIDITGPAAGHPWMQVSYDPTGAHVHGMFNNCGGGKTPWGTILTCEENFNQYFANRSAVTDPAKLANLTRYGVTAGATERKWERFHSRFDLAKEPNESFRFGWVVEIDPYNPDFVPKKRTALGRTKHEAATVVIAPDRRVVVYAGDDERFEFVYKFVSKGTYDPRNREANIGLLDEGTLYVAKFNDDGTGEWLPLLLGEGRLTEEAWESQAYILINTRLAATAVGATRMDRPEDIQPNPVTGKIYGAFTNNTQRGTTGRPGVDEPNPRPANRHGHVIEWTEADNDPSATSFTWEIFILCGDPKVNLLTAEPDAPVDTETTYYAGFSSEDISPIASPDNVTFDGKGNLWIASDGLPNTLPGHDGIFAVPTEGSERGYLRQFLSAVIGSEVASLELTPNDHTLFASIQHPGEGSTLAAPSSTWPDRTFPRPSVVAVTKDGIGRKPIGS